jgi:catechol 2,3-dioxygenase-like lactoylglutathione lyase family enzyme
MPVRIAQVAIDASNPATLADFWCQVLGWEVVDEEDDVVCIGPSDGGPGIDFVPVPEAKIIKNRLHLDLRADGSTQDQEVTRLLALGARPADVGQEADASWVVLADPEGNEFCVLSRSMQEM